MKILHTSDWHLGKRLYNRDRLAEQRIILNEINKVANEQNVDVILVAGDLFDAVNPSNEAMELCYKALKQMSKNGVRPVIAIAGNHDSPHRIEAPDSLARECGIIFLGYPTSKVAGFELDDSFKVTRSDEGFLEIFMPQHTYPLRLIATPYASEIRMKQFFENDEEQSLRDALENQWRTLAEKYCDAKGVNILMAHLFVWNRDTDLPEEPDGEKPIRIGNASVIYADLFPNQMQYVALGHLHRSQSIKGSKTQVQYSGSPLAYSFSEVNQKKYVHIVDVEPEENPKISRIELKQGVPLKQKTFELVDEAVKWLTENQNAYTEITMCTDNYLKSEENKRLCNASKNLINIIPQPKNRLINKLNEEKIDVTQSVSSLFKRYFFDKYRQKPNEEILNLFNEALNLKESK